VSPQATTAQDTHRYLRAFGRNVKVQRVRLDLTQEQLAERAGLCRTFIGKLERGQTGINLVELPALAQALGIRPAELLPNWIGQVRRQGTNVDTAYSTTDDRWSPYRLREVSEPGRCAGPADRNR
jgi:transcriptional regulator with XRE-family HTH domain